MSVDYYGAFRGVAPNQIEPQGWLKEYLVRQKNGLGENVHMSGYPFNTQMFKESVRIPTGHVGEGWWPYEQTGYYLDGIIRAGHLLKDQDLIERGRSNIESVIENPLDDNILGPDLNSDWSRVVFFRVMMADYEATGNKAILDAMEKHFLTRPRIFLKWRDNLAVEALMWLYDKTGNEELKKVAEKSFACVADEEHADADIKNIFEQLKTEEKSGEHGVTWCENVKIPVIMYLYTGNSEYLDVAVSAFDKMRKYHMLVDGCPSSVEYFRGNAVDMAHESCDVADLGWSLGYFLQATGDVRWADMMERLFFNAALGAITKDFKAHQYYSAPNQAVCAENTSQFDKHPGWGPNTPLRLCYRPQHDTECCSGNIHRMMPVFGCRMWMKTKDNGLAATLYGPGTVSEVVGATRQKVQIDVETAYPFDEKIKFVIKTESPVAFPLKLRIPHWCANASVCVNDVPLEQAAEAGTFITIERVFEDSDTITLTLPMEVRLARCGEDVKGVAVERGPLVYSHPVEAREIKYLEGQAIGMSKFPSRFLYPASHWAYALAVTEETIADRAEVASVENTGYPYDVPPVAIKVPARKVLNWDIEGTYHTPVWPASLELAEEEEMLRLVPLGSTLLRMTIFPEDKV